MTEAYSTNFDPDNKTGLRMCNTLLREKDLTDWERDFIASIADQIANHPRKFRLSRKQRPWFEYIWYKYVSARHENNRNR